MNLLMFFIYESNDNILLSADIYMNPKGCISYGRQMYILPVHIVEKEKNTINFVISSDKSYVVNKKYLSLQCD